MKEHTFRAPEGLGWKLQEAEEYLLCVQLIMLR
jgi:hypothetical protein